MRLSGSKIFGIVLIIASVTLIALQATRNESSVTFYTPEEIYATPGKFSNKTFRVSGLVLHGSKQWDAETQNLAFKISSSNFASRILE